MGASFAVSLAHAVTCTVVVSEGISALSSFKETIGLRLCDKDLRLPYIEDVNTVGTIQRGVKRSTKGLAARLARNGLPTEEGKNIWSDCQFPDIGYRFQWRPSGEISPKPDSLHQMVS